MLNRVGGRPECFWNTPYLNGLGSLSYKGARLGAGQLSWRSHWCLIVQLSLERTKIIQAKKLTSELGEIGKGRRGRGYVKDCERAL